MKGAGLDVRQLSEADIRRAWEQVDLEACAFEAQLAAARTVRPDFPYSEHVLDGAIARGELNMIAVRWPNGLRGIAAWRPGESAGDAIFAAYARTWAALEHLRRRPQDFVRAADLLDMPVHGHG